LRDDRPTGHAWQSGTLRGSFAWFDLEAIEIPVEANVPKRRIYGETTSETI
jgi:hypothetical protein